MLTAIYPFVHSECDDLELLLSVRSLKRLATPVSGVMIVGDKPKCWDELVKEAPIEHRPHKSATKVSPVKDVLAKTLLACEVIKGDVLFLHDDMLVLQDQARIQHEYRGKITAGKGYWGFVSRQTLMALGFKAETLNYECHTPVVMNTDLFKQVFSVPCPKDRLMKSLYLNSPGVRKYHADQGIQAVPGANRKMRHSDALDRPTINVYRTQTAFLSMHHLVPKGQIENALSEGFV